MRRIDMETWPRREHFRFFNGLACPHFNLCANVDITAFHPWVKRKGVSFTVAMVYVIARTANAIPEFRYRIQGEAVVDYEVVHPSTTILTGGDLLSFCSFTYSEDFSRFAAHAAEKIAHVKAHLTFGKDPDPNELLFMTSIPWVSFTGIMHPINLNPADSVPRFAWGKFFEEGGRLKMPLSVQAHHALVDGIHAGRFYTSLQETLGQPEAVLGAA